MRLDGTSEVRRRAFLTTTLASISGLLADRLSVKDVLSGSPLTQLSDAVVRLRYLDGRDGAASVLMPTRWLADRLADALPELPAGHELRVPLAGVAADAAELAGWVAFETGEYTVALRLYDRAISAAMQARNADLTAFACEARARVLLFGFDAPHKALAQLSTIKLDPISPTLRAHVHICRARVLAVQGNESATHRAVDAAMGNVARAASSDWSSEPSPFGWVISPTNVQIARGLALADLGYGYQANELLTASMRGVPPGRRRVAGTLHRGLAQAALLRDEPVQAAGHVLKAHEIFTATESRQLATVMAIARTLRDRYGDVTEVRELEEQLRTATRFVTTRSMRGWRKIHQRTCPTLNRGQTPHATSWREGTGLEPAEVVALVAGRPAEARPRLEVCQTCMIRR